jgi:hypothetical protein
MEKFESWAMVELYGHQRIVGKVSEATIGGCAFVRVDVPEIGEKKAFTRFFGNGAIYSLNPVSEEIAQELLKTCRNEPVKPYEIPGHSRFLEAHEIPEDPDTNGYHGE